VALLQAKRGGIYLLLDTSLYKINVCLDILIGELNVFVAQKLFKVLENRVCDLQPRGRLDILRRGSADLFVARHLEIAGRRDPGTQAAISRCRATKRSALPRRRISSLPRGWRSQ